MSSSEARELLMKYLNSRSTYYDNLKHVFKKAEKNTDLITTGPVAMAFSAVFDSINKDNEALKALVQAVVMMSDEIDKLRQQSGATDQILLYIIRKLSTVETNVDDKRELNDLKNRLSLIERDNKRRKNTFNIIDNYARAIKTAKKVPQKVDFDFIK